MTLEVDWSSSWRLYASRDRPLAAVKERRSAERLRELEERPREEKGETTACGA